MSGSSSPRFDSNPSSLTLEKGEKLGPSCSIRAAVAAPCSQEARRPVVIPALAVSMKVELEAGARDLRIAALEDRAVARRSKERVNFIF